MVLIRRPRRFAVLCLVVMVGCNQSLFDARGAAPSGSAGDDDGGSGVVPSSCPSPCLADAAADFDGTPGGAGNHWRYLDDHRDRTWAPMTASAMTMTGSASGNLITTCAAKPSAPACKTLPGALLVSSSGATSAADPAVEVTAAKSQVIQLSVHAFVASGADQTIRIYRNSREDVLYTGAAATGTALDHALTLDALAGDRFLVAVAPTGDGATDVGLQVFVNPTGAVFPSTCQVAMQFASAAGNTVDNLCGGDFTHAVYDGQDSAAVLAAGPYTELGSAADFTLTNYFHGVDVIDKSHDTTLQLWVKHRAFDADFDDAWLFSDLDFNSDTSQGLSVVIGNVEPPTLVVRTCSHTGPDDVDCFRAIAYPTDSSWQFVRVVHTNGNVNLCVNGVRKASFPIAPGNLQSTFPPDLGANQRFGPQGAFFDGELDDVRVITGALPCD